MSESLSLLVAIERCPLCGRSRTQLTCQECIKRGNFVNSKLNSNVDPLSFAYLRKRLLVVCSVRDATLKRINLLIDRVNNINKKRAQVIGLKEKVKLMKTATTNFQSEIIQDNESVDVKRKLLSDKKRFVHGLEEKVKKIRESQKLKERKAKHQHMVEKLCEKQDQLKQMRQHCLKDLLTNIFCLSEKDILSGEKEDQPATSEQSQASHHCSLLNESNMTTESELEEALHTVHIDGKWISQKIEEKCVTIVGVVTPTSVDFQKYYEWLLSYRNEPKHAESQSSLHKKEVLSIPASLIYISQLIDVAALLLGVNLPHHIDNVSVGSLQSSRQRIYNNVNRLMENVMYICFSQLVPMCNLEPQEIMSNLNICFSKNNSQLGHCGAFDQHEYNLPDCHFDSDTSTEDLNFESDISEDELFHDRQQNEEWDELLDLNEEGAYSPTLSQPQGNSSSNSLLSSSAGGLVTSAAASVASALWSWKQ